MKRFGFYMAAATVISMGISSTAALSSQAACTTAITAKNFPSANSRYTENYFSGSNSYGNCFSGSNSYSNINRIFNNSCSIFNTDSNKFNSNFYIDKFNNEEYFPGQNPTQNGCNKPNQNQPGQTTPDTDKPGQGKPDTDKPGQDKPEQDKPGTDKPGQTTPDNDSTNAAFVQQVIHLVNEERAKAGLSPLRDSSALSDAAYIRSKEITQNFSHTRPNGSSFSSVLQQNGISFSSSGENIAYGQRTPQEVMNTWMNSSGHRANILNRNYTDIGVGCYQTGNGTLYWTQLFTR